MNYKKEFIIISFFLSFFFLFSCITLWRFNIAQVFYYDFGIFARPLWEIAHGLTPLIYHKTLGEIHFLGDHFSPSLYLLAPLFLFKDSLWVLLIEQALAVTLSGYFLFLIAQKENVGLWSSLAVSFIFFIFAGTVNPLVTDWHTESTAAAFLLLFIYLFFYKKKYYFGGIAALIFLGLKESNAISFLLVLIPYYYLYKKERRKIIILGVTSLAWFFLTTKLIIPSILKQPYYYAPQLPHNPLEYLTQFFSEPQKISLIVQSFISFGFLPLMSIPFLIPIMGELGIRLIPVQSHFQSFTLGMHYNVFLGVFLALATLNALTHIPNKIVRLLTVWIIICLAVLVGKKYTNSPFFLATNSVFWKEWYVKSSLVSKLTCIPRHGSIMSQNNILPHLIQRKEKIYLLSSHYQQLKPDSIVIDMRPGQNSNNYYSGEMSSVTQVEGLIQMILKDPTYFKDTTTCPSFLLFRRK